MRRFCYYVDPNPAGREVCLVTHGVPGYVPQAWPDAPTLQAAEEKAEQLNADLGLTPDDVSEIVTSSMEAQAEPKSCYVCGMILDESEIRAGFDTCEHCDTPAEVAA